jgi:hypothetical protein
MGGPVTTPESEAGMNDERAAEGLDHLQAAALEMIKAARAFLDVAEDLVADREKVADVVSALGAVADVTTRAVRDRGVHGASGSDTGRGAGRGTDGDADSGSSVQHIRVSS